MGKKNRSAKADKGKPSFQDQLKIKDLVKELLAKSSIVARMNKAEEWENYQSIYDILQQIMTLQKAPARPGGGPGSRLARVQELHGWLLQQGGRAPGLEAADFAGYGLGLRCTEPLAPCQTAIQVPRAVMLSLDTARQAKIGPFIAGDKLTSAMPQLGLTLHLLEEALSEDSRWTAYIRALPDTYDTVLYFTPAEVEMLRGSPCFEEALKQCRNIARQYAYYYGCLHHCPEARSLAIRDNFTFENYRWAASTVMTRMNNIPSEEDPGTAVPALIPYWDLCNHSNGRVSTDYCHDPPSSICFAFRDFAPGEQFHIFYGVRPNAEFLLHNGFVDADNEHDAVAVRLGVSRGDPLHEPRARLLERLGVPASGLFYLHREGSPIDGSLFTFLRVFNMDAETLEHWLRVDNVGDLGSEQCDGLPAGLQLAAWRFLHTRVTLLLRLYPGTAEADRALLAAPPAPPPEGAADAPPPLTPRARMAVTLRLGEKLILQRALRFATDKMHEQELLDQELKSQEIQEPVEQ
ncbi:actin-histidine N-methyltransferase-like [Amphibalanus amphitrite]|uniref:actin-histidine N-methyltransferase-like n=1 Tax=Amphibalanus amphitrite TaxID=1232801 RepID=UPI001C8FE17B|nr:actin-histidine N-methyltransferase-like [Amphibalanus amphitrite]XP_043189062.1 actin-histidine N-methyltransferase-like [Amphibalanus amphitrite]